MASALQHVREDPLSSRDYLLYADQILSSMMIPGKVPANVGKDSFSSFGLPAGELPEPFSWLPLIDREQPTMKFQQPQQYRLCVKVPGLGSFYLFAEPNKRVAELIPNVELKVCELYRAFISVHKLQSEEGIDLPFGCTVSSVLQNHALVSVQYTRNAEAFGADQPLSPTFYPVEYQARVELENGQSYRQGIKFRDAPPTKVIQNKEFSFSVSAKGQPTSVDDEQYLLAEQLHYDNVWGAPVPLPRGDDSRDEAIPICSGDRGDVPFEIVVEEEGGGMLHSRDFGVRSSVLDKKRGLFVFFVKIKKNSHYGRTRFIIKVKERKIKKRASKDHRDHNGGYEQLEGLWARELLASAPIVVVSKERKAMKRKKNKKDSMEPTNMLPVTISQPL